MSGKTEYSNTILSSVSPAQAADIVRERMANAQNLNDSVAEWVRERARIEETYAAELEKLSKKGPSAKELGEFSTTWETVLTSIKQNAQGSSKFAHKLEKEVEMPLRNYTHGGQHANQWKDLKEMQQGLSSMASKVMHSEESYDKLRKKSGGRQDKTEHAQVQLAEDRSQWENQAPYILEQVESMDQARLVLLKDTLTRFGTLQVDNSQNGIKNTEKALNTVLSFEPLDDMRAFLTKISSGGASELVGSSSLGRTNSMRDNAPLPEPPRPFRTPTDDSASVNSAGATSHSGSTSGQATGASKLRSKVGSIFRKNKYKGTKDKTGWDLPNPNYIPPDHRGSTGRAESVNSEFESSGHQPPSQPVSRSSTMKPPPPPSRKANGPQQQQPQPGNYPPLQPQSQQQMPPPPPQQQKQQPPLPQQQQQMGAVEEQEREVERENGGGGDQPFRVDIRQDIITEEGEDANAALSNVASTLRARPTVSGRGMRGRRDIQSKLFTNIEQSDVESQASQQRQVDEMQPAVTGDSVTNAPVNTSPKPPSQFLSQLQTFPSPKEPASGPSSPAVQSPALSEGFQQQQQQQQQNASSMYQHHGPSSETQSVRSMQSSTSTNVAGRQIELPQAPGLCLSVVEVVNALVKDGAVVRKAAMGEIGFGYNVESGQPPPTQIELNVSNIDKVDRIIPNQSFIQAKNESVGQYEIKGNGISHILGLKHGLNGMRYVRREAEVRVPLIFTPIWRVEEGQSSLMLMYKFDEVAMPDEQHVTVEDLVVSVSVEGEGKAVTAQSKPVAAFNKERQKITWKFTEPVTLTRGKEEQILCRFATEGGSVKEGSKGIDVKFRLVRTREEEEDLMIGYRVSAKDPFDDDEEASTSTHWKEAKTVRCIASGKYAAQSEKNIQFK